MDVYETPGPAPRSNNPVVVLRVPAQMLAKIEARVDSGASLNRSEAIRALIAEGLRTVASNAPARP
jgi:Arc/MetJ-type ribon-helix-helix transcriptional regulator